MSDPENYDEHDYEERPEGAEWCDRCQGLGIADCHCGGIHQLQNMIAARSGLRQINVTTDAGTTPSP